MKHPWTFLLAGAGFGPKRLYVSYYRKRMYADLLPDDSIRYKNQIYTSPVPCALEMKRSLNPCTSREHMLSFPSPILIQMCLFFPSPPALKTDTVWLYMYSAVSGESLKDFKDQLNIRRLGTNARSTQKEMKTPTPSPITKDRGAQSVAAKNIETAPLCISNIVHVFPLFSCNTHGIGKLDRVDANIIYCHNVVIRVDRNPVDTLTNDNTNTFEHNQRLIHKLKL
ncbi:hypothetical protein PsorP6_015318 [Peronosclerospora sorghi]|uniref:Uncharacterized protein n=1 Tax=Peronosclerospora sorghi TaxID=230839 RepID=A0ACC0VSU2_9STRA|nr:hypothetical protein PsorP6_015318 [Peronosclerospora sorghi]